MIEDIRKDAMQRMSKSIDSFKQELSKLRTGRAHPSLLDHIHVDYYGSEMPLNQVSSVTASDARTLTVQPWEQKMVPVIEKAILASDLGLNPSTAGTVIRIPMPALTEERRRDLVKVVRHEGENARIAIRNIRRDANSHFKQLLKDKDITEDQERQAETAIQKLTDQYISQIEELLQHKEAELMEV